MADIDILEQTRKLVDLQKLDGEIFRMKKDLKEKPKVLAQLKEEFESKKAHLKELEAQFKTMQVARNSLETDLKAKEDEIAKANSQLSAIKTNKEYTAKITEIEGLKADKSLIEEKILKSYDETDACKDETAKEQELLKQEEQKYQQQKKEIDDQVKVLEGRVKELEAKRGGITPQINKTTLSRYEKILENKDGQAIVPITGSSCGGCYMNVPPQVINEVKMHDKVIFCESCARILYLEEDMAVTPEPQSQENN